MHVSIPFTLKDFPDSLKKLNVGNDFALLPVYLKFPKERSLNSFYQILSIQKKVTKSSKSFFKALGTYYVMKYFISSIRFIQCYFPKLIATNYTTVLSTVPGPKTAWKFKNLQVRELFYFVPGIGSLACGISVITHGDHVQVTVNCDTSYFPKDTHKLFIKKFELIFQSAHA